MAAFTIAPVTLIDAEDGKGSVAIELLSESLLITKRPRLLCDIGRERTTTEGTEFTQGDFSVSLCNPCALLVIGL